MTERTFRIHKACAAVGIAPHRLHQWICRGYFVPLRGTQRGIARDYTLRDIVHIAAIVELESTGLSLSRSIQILGVSPVDNAGREIVSANNGNTEIRLDLASIADRVRTALM